MNLASIVDLFTKYPKHILNLIPWWFFMIHKKLMYLLYSSHQRHHWRTAAQSLLLPWQCYRGLRKHSTAPYCPGHRSKSVLEEWGSSNTDQHPDKESIKFKHSLHWFPCYAVMLPTKQLYHIVNNIHIYIWDCTCYMINLLEYHFTFLIVLLYQVTTIQCTSSSSNIHLKDLMFGT